jgi:hypothetical protein
VIITGIASLVFTYVIILYARPPVAVIVYSADPLPLAILKLLVVKFGLAPEVTLATVPDVRDPEIFVPIPATVRYGVLNKLWFHSAETTGIKLIDSEFLNISVL